MTIDKIGELEKDEEYGGYYGPAKNFKVLNNNSAYFIIENYDENESPQEYIEAMDNFNGLSNDDLIKAQDSIFEYYLDIKKKYDKFNLECIEINNPNEVWNHIEFGDELIISRRPYGDRKIYISIECNCDWEKDHGLQIVFKNGLKINKIGPYDSHLTNSDAFGNKSYEEVIYVKL